MHYMHTHKIEKKQIKVTILTSYSMQLPGKNLSACFSISSLGNRKLNIRCANLIISILHV